MLVLAVFLCLESFLGIGDIVIRYFIIRVALLVIIPLSTAIQAQLNIYSHRHYDSDKILFKKFFFVIFLFVTKIFASEIHSEGT